MGSNATLEMYTIQRRGDDYVSASPAVLMIIMSTHDDDDDDGGADDDDDDDDDDDNYHRSILCISNDNDNYHRGNASAAPFPCASPFQEQGSADMKGTPFRARPTLDTPPFCSFAFQRRSPSHGAAGFAANIFPRWFCLV